MYSPPLTYKLNIIPDQLGYIVKNI